MIAEIAMDDLTRPHYDTDFLLWLESQAALLRTKSFDQLDTDNLIAELDDMGRRYKHELRSRLKILLAHLLKCAYQPAHISANWLGTLETQRDEIAQLLLNMPSLANAVADSIASAYPKAVRLAALETQLPISSFPANNPYTTEQLLDPDFIPAPAP
jgi:hypothetical protein